MRVPTVAVVTLAILVSGCASEEANIGPAGDNGAAPGGNPATGQPASASEDQPRLNASTATEVEDTGPKALRFDETFQLTLTHVHIPSTTSPTGGTRFNFDKNCVGFGKDQVWLMLNGTAEATWTATGAFAQRMTVDVRDIGLMATNNGSASPSVLEFGRFQTVPNALLGLWFIVQPTDPGVVAGQTVSLHIAFNYLGRPNLETTVQGCVYSAAFEDETKEGTA
jgi:hypothetical protein